MPAITATYFGSFSLVTRKRREHLDVGDGQTVGAVARMLTQTYGRPFAELLEREAVTFLVNSEIVQEECVLKEGDELAFTTLVGGG